MKPTGWARSISYDNAVNQGLKIVLFNWVARNLSELPTLRNCVGPDPSLLGTLVPGLEGVLRREAATYHSRR
jgi:hypothetical protein